MINFSKGQEDWILRLTEYPQIIEKNAYYSHVLNILGNDRTEKYGHWYSLISKAILNKLKTMEEIPFPFNILVTKDNIDTLPEDRLFSIFSFFTCYMNKPMIKKFGQPLYHSEFGEGFDNPKLKKYLYASYFIEVSGVEMEIGWDNRGSTIRVDDSKSPKEICDSLIELANYIL